MSALNEKSLFVVVVVFSLLLVPSFVLACGDKDTDGDGVVDSQDACPDIYGIDCNGCPNPCSGCAIMSCDTCGVNPPTCVAGTCPDTICPSDGCGLSPCSETEWADYPESVANTCEMNGNVGTCTQNACQATCTYNESCVPYQPPQPSVDRSWETYGGCIPYWNCTNWTDCLPSGIKTRNCTDVNKCEQPHSRPVEVMNCTYVPMPTVTPVAVAPVSVPSCVENWICTNWSICVNGTQTRNCTDVNNCNTTVNKSAESQPCIPIAYCGDAICQENENCTSCSVDCGTCPSIGITGMLVSVVTNPIYIFLLVLLVIAIMTTFWRMKVEKKG